MNVTSTNYFMPDDWREKVAAMTATNDQDIEKAFSDQASGFVENQVGDLMKDQHRVGFEIVKKNADNTKMVGIFCFRVGSQVIYAPVFFLNGEIKGPMLYRASTRTFVPANKEWASFLIESMEMSEGKGRDRTNRVHAAPLVRMRDIAFLPPGMGKRAAAPAPNFSTVPESGKNSNSSQHVAVAEYGKNTPSTEVAAIYSLLPGGTKVINVPAKWKKIDAPCGCMTGEYAVNLKSEGKQPELTTGETTVKLANWDDGTVRMEMSDRWEPLTQEDAAAIKSAAWQGTASIRLSSPDIELVFDKAASAQIEEFINAPSDRAFETLQSCFDKVASFMEEKGIIAQFLTEPDFGQPASEAILKAASSNYEFAEMLASIYGDPENLLPKQFAYTEKKASSATDKELAMFYDPEELKKSAGYNDCDMREFFKSGYVMKDTRDKDPLAVVWDLSPSDIQAPEDAGEYAVLMQDGTFLENALVVHGFVGCVGNAGSADNKSTSCHRGTFYVDDSDTTSPKLSYYVIHDGKLCATDEVFGMKTKPIGSSSKVQDKPSQGKVYYVYIKCTNTAFGPVSFDNIKNADGVLHCQCSYDKYHTGHDTYTYKRSQGNTLIVNKDVEDSDVANGILGADALFIPVEIQSTNTDKYCCDDINVKPLLGVGGGKHLDQWIFEAHGVSKAEVESKLDGEKQASFRIGDGERMSAWLPRTSMLIKLAADLDIPGDKAYEIVNRAEKEGSYGFYLQHPMNKQASHLVLADRPNLDDTFSTEFGIPLEPVKKFVLRVQGDQIQPTPSAIGDAYDPTTPTGLPDFTVATTEPENLQQLADIYHLPNVFEHGVIGALADTFNATYLVDKYRGKIEDAVDVLGRIKFLLYWCPADFEKAYGTDDMQNFEAEVDSNFDNLGAFLLKLLKRSDKQRSGKKQESEKSQ